MQHIQRSLAAPIVRTLSEGVFTSAESEFDRARLKAAASAHSWDWLNAPLIASGGLLLSDEDIRLSVAQRLGVKACSPYTCANPSTREVCMACHARDPWHVISVTPWSMISSGEPWNVPKFQQRTNGFSRRVSCRSEERQETGWCHAYTMVKGQSTGVGRHHSRYVCDVAHPVNIRWFGKRS